MGCVITLHRVTGANAPLTGLNSFIEIKEDKLETAIVELKKLGSKFISLSEMEQSIYNRGSIVEPLVHISFDDGYYDNYSRAFPILKKHHICFSIFVVSDFMDNSSPFLWWYLLENIVENELPVSFEKYGFEITPFTYATVSKAAIFEQFRQLVLENADRDQDYFKDKLFGYAGQAGKVLVPATLSWQQVNEMLESGLCEIGVHTKTHPRFNELSTAERMEEINACRQEIKKHTGIDAAYFAYPYGSQVDIGGVDSIEEVMKACGIRLAFTTQSLELNALCNKHLLPREFLNNSATGYTLKTRLTGAYQRSIPANKIS